MQLDNSPCCNTALVVVVQVALRTRKRGGGGENLPCKPRPCSTCTLAPKYRLLGPPCLLPSWPGGASMQAGHRGARPGSRCMTISTEVVSGKRFRALTCRSGRRDRVARSISNARPNGKDTGGTGLALAHNWMRPVSTWPSRGCKVDTDRMRVAHGFKDVTHEIHKCGCPPCKTLAPRQCSLAQGN
jgi:hypothetical protein